MTLFEESQQEKYIYNPHTSKITVNELDPDLFKWDIDILDHIQRCYRQYGMEEPGEFPDISIIDGYGIPPEKQKFQYPIVPIKLQQLVKDVNTTVLKDNKYKKLSTYRKEIEQINLFWESLEQKSEHYQEEVDWIYKQWYHRFFGYWFFNNGTPTYIDGWHYFYLTSYWLNTKSGKPDYRDRDRRWFISVKSIFLETRTFAHIDKDGWAVANEDGTYEMIDTFRKLFCGVLVPKSRGVGDSSKTSCINLEIATRSIDNYHGIQGKDGDNAEKTFDKLINKPFIKMPIWQKPLYAEARANSLIFNARGDIQNPIGSDITFAESKDKRAYDSQVLHFYQRDEPGKVKYEDIDASHEIVRKCLIKGDVVHGYCVYVSTVGEMEDGMGGQQFQKLCLKSFYNQRTKSGNTLSWLAIIYFPSYDGLEGFIDEYGMSIIHKPTKQQAKYIGKNYGALEHIERQIQEYINKKDIEGLCLFKREYCTSFRESFTLPPKSQMFKNIPDIEDRIAELSLFPKGKRGNFYRLTKDGDVNFIQDESGKFTMYYELPKEKTNRRISIDGVFVPQGVSDFVASADCYRVEQGTSGKLSDGAGAVKMKHNQDIDSHDIDITKHKTGNIACTYLHRPDTEEEYAEDMLMMCQYYSCKMFPENNLDTIEKHFLKRNYAGYLLYETNVSGDDKPKAGFYANVNNKQKMFNLSIQYVLLYAKIIPDVTYLKQCLRIGNLDDTRKNDLFVAVGGCLLAEQLDVMDYETEENTDNSAIDFAETFSY